MGHPGVSVQKELWTKEKPRFAARLFGFCLIYPEYQVERIRPPGLLGWIGGGVVCFVVWLRWFWGLGVDRKWPGVGISRLRLFPGAGGWRFAPTFAQDDICLFFMDWWGM